MPWTFAWFGAFSVSLFLSGVPSILVLNEASRMQPPRCFDVFASRHTENFMSSEREYYLVVCLLHREV